MDETMGKAELLSKFLVVGSRKGAGADCFCGLGEGCRRTQEEEEGLKKRL